MSPVPQIVDAVKLPCIWSFGVQMGTVFLLADETKTSALHRKRLKEAASGGDAAETAITNVFSGRPARGFVARVMRELGPVSVAA
ncbi:Aldolase-type TIM barrel [Phytophthora cactorum]|nr:Aldolase-type TIM barrel [Phytophthora cactorum]